MAFQTPSCRVHNGNCERPYASVFIRRETVVSAPPDFNTHPCADYAHNINMRIEAIAPQSATPCASLLFGAVGFQHDIMALIGRAPLKASSFVAERHHRVHLRRPPRR